MKKKKITYGVQGMMEYHAIVKVGKASMKVSFTDGSATSFGCTPATFTTEDLIVQLAIENSYDYKRGRIVKCREIELDEEIQVASNHTPKNEAEEEAKIQAEKKESEASAATEDGVDTSNTKVSFSTNDDAKEYLEVNYGINRVKLRKRDDIVEAGKTVGVDIVFE